MSSTQSAQPMTAADRIKEAMAKRRPTPSLPPRVGAGSTNRHVKTFGSSVKEEPEEILEELTKPKKKRTPSRNHERMAKRLQVIAETAAPIVGLTMKELLGTRRTREIARRRQVIIYFMLYYTGCSLRDAARIFGHVDHTSAKHAKKKVEGLLELGPDSMMHAKRRVKNLLGHGPTKRVVGELATATLNAFEKELLVKLRNLCQRHNKKLPSSAHWPEEEPLG